MLSSFSFLAAPFPLSPTLFHMPAQNKEMTHIFTALIQISFAFFLVELKSRKVIHVNVTCTPADSWVARTAAGSNSV